jgi:hypothetical protein
MAALFQFHKNASFGDDIRRLSDFVKKLHGPSLG